MATHFRTCNLCEAMCGLAITVEGNRIEEIRGDADDLFSRGHLCPKGPAMKEIYEDPDRLRHPVRRVSNGWQRLTWDEAFEEAGTRLSAVRARHGRDSLGVYVGNPVVHNHGALLMLPGFLRSLQTKNRFDANSVDTNPRLLANALIYGDQYSVPIPDVDRTDYLLMLGANPAASNGSLMTLGDVRGRLKGLAKRGAKLVLIDPRRTETAAWANEHHFIRPAGDAAFLLALLHAIFAIPGRVDDAAVAKVASGLPEVRALAANYPPERVAGAVGIDAATIRRIASELCAAKAAVVYGRVGTCTQELGTVASWLIDCVNVVTGNFDRPGGAMFTEPAMDLQLGSSPNRPARRQSHRWTSRVRGLPEVGGTLPSAVIAEEMETPGPGQIRGFLTVSGNPVLSTPNGERLARALAGLEYMVSVDFYVNETTRHANLILPGVHSLERSHFDLIFNSFAVRNVAKYGAPVLPKPAGGLEDWEILYELAMRLGGLGTGVKLVDAAVKLAWRGGLKVSPDTVLAAGLRLSRRGVTLGRLKAAPHGIDLGPLRSCREKKVRGPEHLAMLNHPMLLQDSARVERWVEANARRNGELTLIGRRHLRSNNSWMHNCASLVKGPERATALLHPADAARLGVVAGRQVRLRTRVGEVTAIAQLSDEMMPGVVSLPHGFGHKVAADTLRIAGATKGPNANAITDDAQVDPLSGTAVLNGVPVVVEPVLGDAAEAGRSGSEAPASPS